MPVAQKRLLIVGCALIFAGMLFGIPMALHKNYTADGIGGIIVTIGQFTVLLSVGVGMIARGE